MLENKEKLISLKEASQTTPYSSDYLGLLVRKGKLEAYKKDGRWFTTARNVERYLKKTAESSYEHQQTLNVRIPEIEIKKAVVNFKWAIFLIIFMVLSAVIVWMAMGREDNFSLAGDHRIIIDSDNNLTIYLKNPQEIKSVKLLPKE